MKDINTLRCWKTNERDCTCNTAHPPGRCLFNKFPVVHFFCPPKQNINIVDTAVLIGWAKSHTWREACVKQSKQLQIVHFCVEWQNTTLLHRYGEFTPPPQVVSCIYVGGQICILTFWNIRAPGFLKTSCFSIHEPFFSFIWQMKQSTCGKTFKVEHFKLVHNMAHDKRELTAWYPKSGCMMAQLDTTFLKYT
jgi:hypothetical protein